MKGALATGILVMGIASQALAIPSLCEGLDELDPVDHDDLALTVRRASVFPEFGLMIAGGVRGPDPVRAASRLELSAGVTRATTRDLDTICARGHLPSAYGVHGVLAWDRFSALEAGGFIRYYNQLNHSALVPVWEGGATVTLSPDHAVEGRVGIGIGNPMFQAMLHLASTGEVHRAEVGIRLDLGVLRFLLGV